MATHSSTLAWKIPWTEEPGGLQSMGSWRVGHDWTASLSRVGEGNGNPLRCFCLENPRDGRACGLPSMGSHRVRHNWSDLAAAAIKEERLCFMWKTPCMAHWVSSESRGGAEAHTRVLISKKPAEQWLTNARDHGEADLLDTASWLIFPHVSKSPSESVLVYMKIKPIENWCLSTFLSSYNFTMWNTFKSSSHLHRLPGENRRVRRDLHFASKTVSYQPCVIAAFKNI